VCPASATRDSTMVAFFEHPCCCCIALCCTADPQERFTCKEAMAHPYFAPVREREGWDVNGEPVGAAAAAAGNNSSGGGRS
jgi:hypothetical protein